jgi:transposase
MTERDLRRQSMLEEVATLRMAGYSQREIAAMYGWSTRTVRRALVTWAEQERIDGRVS